MTAPIPSRFVAKAREVVEELDPHTFEIEHEVAAIARALFDADREGEERGIERAAEWLERNVWGEAEIEVYAAGVRALAPRKEK